MNLVIRAHKTGKSLKKYQKDYIRRKISISGIPKSWGDKDLEEFFLDYGKIENAYVMKKTREDQELLNGVVIFSAKKNAKKCCEMKQIKTQFGFLKVDQKLKRDNGKSKDEDQTDEQILRPSSYHCYEIAQHQVKPTLRGYFTREHFQIEALKKEFFMNFRVNYPKKG